MQCFVCKNSKMCRSRNFQLKWSCNTACLCGIVIPLRVGVILNSFWIICNGLAFPVMSWLFWPHEYIFIPICFVGLSVVLLGVCLLLSALMKMAELVDFVVYGLCAAYISGGLYTIVSVYIDPDTTKQLIIESFKKHFGSDLSERIALQYVHSIQIMFYAYLFVSYVYCGFVAQMFQYRVLDDRFRNRARI